MIFKSATRHARSAYFVIAWSLLQVMAPPGCFADSPPAPQVTAGNGSFDFIDSKGNADRPLKVWYHRPARWSVSNPIVIVMHGVKRNAAGYCADWEEFADKYNFLVICPQFLEKDYPTKAYQWGNMFDEQNQAIPKNKWTFAAVEHVFDEVRRLTGSGTDEYYLFGHSAGGQFVHRFVMFMPDSRCKRAVAANPGWYTLPVYDGHNYPYGLKKSGLDEAQLKKSMTRDFVIMLGEADTDPNDAELNKGDRAEERGATRFARGQNFFQSATAVAGRLGTKLNWRLRAVPAAHHSDKQMAAAAAPVFFE